MRRLLFCIVLVMVFLPAWAKGPEWYRMDRPCGQITSKDTNFDPAKAKITLYRATKKNLTCCKSMEAVLKTTVDENGNFKLKGVSKGMYWMSLRQGSAREVEKPSGEAPPRVKDTGTKESQAGEKDTGKDEAMEGGLAIHIPIKLVSTKAKSCALQKIAIRKDGSVQVFIETSTE